MTYVLDHVRYIQPRLPSVVLIQVIVFQIMNCLLLYGNYWERYISQGIVIVFLLPLFCTISISNNKERSKSHKNSIVQLSVHQFVGSNNKLSRFHAINQLRQGPICIIFVYIRQFVSRCNGKEIHLKVQRVRGQLKIII